MRSNVLTTGKNPLAYCAAMLLACMLVVSNALADDQVRTETVRFQDLNVDTAAGAEALYHRIHSAAMRVCSQPAQWEQTLAETCARAAEAKAIEKLHLQSLTSYYRTKNGGDVRGERAVIVRR